jgi:hypothetical protein
LITDKLCVYYFIISFLFFFVEKGCILIFIHLVNLFFRGTRKFLRFKCKNTRFSNKNLVIKEKISGSGKTELSTFVVWLSLGPMMPFIQEALSLTEQQAKVLLILNVAMTIPARIIVVHDTLKIITFYAI